MYDIITTGSATVDVFANTHSELIKFVMEDGQKDYISYPSGSKILIKELQFLIGGGGTNTAVSFSRLGLKTAYVGKLGDDANAQKVLELLGEEHIEFIGVQEGQTGYSIVLDSIEHDRTILTFKGANDTLALTELNLNKFDARWFYSSSLTGDSLDTLKSLVDLAISRGIKVAFNPSNYQAKKGYEALKNIVDKCTVLVMNEEEAELLFDHKNKQNLFEEFIRKNSSMYIVITDGSKGVHCFHKDKIYSIAPNPHAKVVETTGAGDAFASGFVAGLATHLPLEEALKQGMVQAESVIGCVGAKNNLLIKGVAQQKTEQFSGKIDVHDLIKKEIVPEKDLSLPVFYESTHEKGFRFDSHHLITGLEELGYYLNFISDAQFKKHVSVHHNHFADWIEHVFELKELANKLRSLHSKKEQSELIITFVHKGEPHEN